MVHTGGGRHGEQRGWGETPVTHGDTRSWRGHNGRVTSPWVWGAQEQLPEGIREWQDEDEQWETAQRPGSARCRVDAQQGKRDSWKEPTPQATEGSSGTLGSLRPEQRGGEPGCVPALGWEPQTSARGREGPRAPQLQTRPLPPHTRLLLPGGQGGPLWCTRPGNSHSQLHGGPEAAQGQSLPEETTQN